MLTTKPSSKFRRKRKLNDDLSFIIGIKSQKTTPVSSNSTLQRYLSSASQAAESPYFSSFTQPYLSSIGNDTNLFNRQQQHTANSQLQQDDDENFDWKLTTISSVPQLVTAAQSRAVLAGRKISPSLRRTGWTMCSSEPAFRTVPASNTTTSVPSTPISNSSMGETSHFFDKTPMRSVLDTIHGPSTYNADDISSNWGQFNTSNFVLQSPWMSRIDFEDSASQIITPSSIFANNINNDGKLQSKDINSVNFSVKELIDIMCGDAEVESVSFMDQSCNLDDVALN